MRSKWALVSIFVLLVLTMAAILNSPPRKAEAATGYVKAGQQAVTATTALVTGMSYGTACVKALNANTINVYLGGPGVTTATGMELAPGNAYCALEVNSNPFYVVAGSTGASVSWITSR